MAFDWKEGLKGALMSPEQFSKYQSNQEAAKKTQAQHEFEVMKMIYQDKLAQDRALNLEEKKHGYRTEEAQLKNQQLAESNKEKRSQRMDDEIYKRYDMGKDQYEARASVPYWVPRGKEKQYGEAKAHYSDDEIKRYLRA